MPTYNYRCDDCGQDFDIVATVEEKIANNPEKFVCAQCGSNKIKQNFSLNTLIEKAGEEGGACKPGGGCC